VHFRVAHTVSSTRYIIFGTDFVENLTCRASPAAGDILKSLPDALGRAGLGREIEKPLIGFGVLHHRTAFPLARQNERAPGFGKMLWIALCDVTNMAYLTRGKR
jgi:hypothetical protein